MRDFRPNDHAAAGPPPAPPERYRGGLSARTAPVAPWARPRPPTGKGLAVRGGRLKAPNGRGAADRRVGQDKCVCWTAWSRNGSRELGTLPDCCGRSGSRSCGSVALQGRFPGFATSGENVAPLCSSPTAQTRLQRRSRTSSTPTLSGYCIPMLPVAIGSVGSWFATRGQADSSLASLLNSSI